MRRLITAIVAAAMLAATALTLHAAPLAALYPHNR